MSVIKTENLTFIYGEGTPFEKKAVDNISLSIEAGQMIGVIGHTGSGKSTLIQHFNGLLKPTSGNVYIDGERLWDDKARLRDIRFKVGHVFQYPEYQLCEETCYKDIACAPKNMGLSYSETDIRIHEAAQMVGISEEILQKSPFELSGGQKRRVAIAGVMAMKPKVLILDEPASGLDPKGSEQILSLLKSYHTTTGSTVMIVSHSMEDVARYADRIIVMNRSSLFCYDETEKVFARADELLGMGLSVPQITKVFNALKQKGIKIDKDIYTTPYAVKYVAGLLGKNVQ